MVDYRKLEKKIFEAILEFPDRIDEMETRSEEGSRRLAARIAAVVRQELSRPEARSP
jgi:hypothetical protein